MSALWEGGADWASNYCIAERHCRNTESVIRRWRNGEKLIPLAALHVLPASLAESLAAGVLGARAVPLRAVAASPTAALHDAIGRLAKPVVASERDATLRSLIEASRLLSEHIGRLATEDR